MTKLKTGTHDEWLAARLDLLDAEKELTRRSDELARRRQERAEAVREARRAMELAPVAKNTMAATAFMGGAVEVLGRAGEIDAAMELLELLFSMPAGREVTVAFLRVWPGFDPLRGDSRFEEVLGRFAAR